MNDTDDLYNLDYIQDPGSHCSKFYCDIQIEGPKGYQLCVDDQQCYYDDAEDLIDSLTQGLERLGYPINENNVYDLKSFFEEVHNTLEEFDRNHYIEFRDLRPGRLS